MEAILIKTKVNYPFIYFFMEPNIVFVYRMETQKYITNLDLSDGSKLESFEISPRDDFETINYEDLQRVEGRGFLISLDSMNKMVKEINKHIQKMRYANRQSCELGAVHIVTSESAAGSLKVGIERPRTVIGFPDYFSIGPLWKLDEKIGQSFRQEWLFENINYELDVFENEHKISNTLREIGDIANHVPIYIWHGNNADEQIGLRFFLYLLRKNKNEIFLVNSAELYERYGTPIEERPISHTSQMDSTCLSMFSESMDGNKPLSDTDRIQFQNEWEILSETKEVLRLWVDGEIKSMPENHYDSFIIETIEKMHQKQGTKDFINTGSVIREVWSQMDGYVDFYFLEYRVRHLVYSGVLELKGIPKSMRHYSIKLR